MPYTTFVDVLLVFLRDNRVLLARRANTGYADGQWNLPSGKLERGEDLVAAAIREAREEVAVELERTAMPLATTVHYLNPEGEARIGFVFRPGRWSSEPRNAEPHKCSELDWFPVGQLPANTVPYSRAAVEQTVDSTPFGLEGWSTAVTASTTLAGR
ncbi:NUDIX hydrolase [Saccharothrix xinjiangensis]|uniref:NUDIX domain-containing protein n=1 Tax=Saccharothrix xinjiangensis TaxID=204798 RepID=A0ABV9Y644_9PSEU